MKVDSFNIECLGYSLAADFYDNNSDKILLSLIGWTSSKSRYVDLLEGICRRSGTSALVFDYSGHGDSPLELDKTRPAQHFLEVICVYDWLKQKYPKAEIAVTGASYGGFMAANLSQWREFSKLILRAPGIYKPEDFYALAPDLRGEALNNYRKYAEQVREHPVFENAENYKGQTLVVIHELDEQIPATTTDAYVAGFGADVYLAKGLAHSFGENAPRQIIEDYQQAISDWLNK